MITVFFLASILCFGWNLSLQAPYSAAIVVHHHDNGVRAHLLELSPVRSDSESRLIFRRPWGLCVSCLSVQIASLSAGLSWTPFEMFSPEVCFFTIRSRYLQYIVSFNETVCNIQFTVFRFEWKQALQAALTNIYFQSWTKFNSYFLTKRWAGRKTIVGHLNHVCFVWLHQMWTVYDSRVKILISAAKSDELYLTATK